MANRTDPLAATVHGTNPQHLIEKITRSKIYNSMYWKEHCFALNAETVIDKCMVLKAVGGTHGGARNPSHFLCLTLKLLQIQPEPEVVREYILQEDSKYLRVLGAFYLRLTGKADQVYRYLEPLYNDFRKVRKVNPDGGFVAAHVDELAEAMIFTDHLFDIALPRLPKRIDLEAQGMLRTRISGLDATNIAELEAAIAAERAEVEAALDARNAAEDAGAGASAGGGASAAVRKDDAAPASPEGEAQRGIGRLRLKGGERLGQERDRDRDRDREGERERGREAGRERGSGRYRGEDDDEYGGRDRGHWERREDGYRDRDARDREGRDRDARDSGRYRDGDRADRDRGYRESDRDRDRGRDRDRDRDYGYRDRRDDFSERHDSGRDGRGERGGREERPQGRGRDDGHERREDRPSSGRGRRDEFYERRHDRDGGGRGGEREREEPREERGKKRGRGDAEAMSVEETNKLREKLGLPPLKP